MSKQRTSLVEGEFDQLTEKVQRKKVRLARWAVRDVAAWLMVYWSREVNRIEVAGKAADMGNRDWAAGVVEDAQRTAGVLVQLIGRLTHQWSQKEWHEAQDFVDRMIAARSDAGEPLHELGRILTARPEPTHAAQLDRTGESIS